ncbi:MAG: hypothetical protein AAFX04_04540 [Pseudomonadota bacterium]
MVARRKDTLQLPKYALWLTLPPIFVFLGGDILYGLLGWHDEFRVESLPPQGWERIEAGLRAIVLTSFLLVMSVMIFIIVVMALELTTMFGPQMRKQLILGSLLIVGAVIVSFVITARTDLIPKMESYTGTGFFHEALSFPLAGDDIPASGNNKAVEASSVARAGKSASLLSTLRGLISVFQSLSLPCVAILIMGTISTLATGRNNAKTIFVIQRRRLQIYLNHSALYLASGVIFLMAWLHWPTFLYESGSAGLKQYHFLINAIGLYFGVNFSLVLLSYYMPVRILQRELFGDEAVDDGNQAEAGLTVIKQLLLLGAPVIASAVPPLVDLITSL